MRDVAERAGVSLTTVSHVINGTRFVSEDLAERVHQAVADLCYQPDRRARSLRRGRSETIALVMSDIGNVFFSEIVRGVEDCILDRGYSAILCNTGEDPDSEMRNLAMMTELRVDGFIVAPTVQGQKNLAFLVEQSTPLVVVDRLVDLPVDQVVSDNECGAYEATKHLIDLGHSRIGAIVEIEGIRTFNDRLAGWRRALGDAGIDPNSSLIQQAGIEIEGASAATRRLLGNGSGVTAIFGSNNLMTLGVLRHARSVGMKCPKDLSIVGFDDPPWASSVNPAITSVAQQPFEMGYRAAEMLVGRIEGDEGRARTVCLDCQLHVRESTANPRESSRDA